MKKILILIDSLGGGGAEKVLYTFLKKWDKNKYQFTIVPIVDTGIYANKVRSIPNINYYPIITNKNKNKLKQIWNAIIYKLIYYYLPIQLVYKFFIPKNNDIEIAFCEGYVTKLLSYSTNTKALKYAWVHTDLVSNNWPLKNGIYQSLLDTTSIYKKFHTVIGVSKSVCNGLQDKYKLDNVQCVYNPIDTIEILSHCNDNTITKDKKYIHIITVGRLTYIKGFDRLLWAIHQLILQNSIPFKLQIIGDGEEKNQLQKLIKELKLENYVDLLGFKENPYIHMSMADLFICSSRDEGFSLAISEAMIIGLPIISTNCSGPKELLDNGEYGILVNNSKEGILEGLTKIMGNNSLIKHFQNKSLNRSQIFNLKNILQQTYFLFDHDKQ